MKTITVVTPVLCPSENALEVILTCMLSVRRAVDRVGGKYTIVDDNSAVGYKYFNNIAKCIKNEKTEGVSVSLNRGMTIADTDFVVKLDSDYLVPENLLEVLLDDWTDDLAFISPSYLLSNPADKAQLKVKNLPIPERGVYDRPPGLAPAQTVPPSKYEWGGGILMFDRKKLAEIDYFDEEFGIGGAQDNDVIYRLLLKGHNWRWDNNVVTRHFASISSRDKQSTQDWRELRLIGVEYFKKKHGFAPGGFISNIYQKFEYSFKS